MMVLAVATTQAQSTNDHAQNRDRTVKNMEPQDIAAIQAKRWTLALDLSDKQQAEVEKILLNNAIKRKELMVNKKDRKDLSKEEKQVLVEKHLDQKIATKRALKDILNEDQYEKFEQINLKKDRNKGNREQRVRRARK